MPPLLIEYKDAIVDAIYKTLQGPHTAVLMPDGQPYFAAGAFGCVFKVTTPNDKLMAIKCFTQHVDNKQNRLAAIASYLNQHPNPYTIPYRYLTGELWVGYGDRPAYHDILTMDWVQGDTLGKWVKQAVEHGRTAELWQIADRFAEMGKWLLAQPLAHGDLKHDNILVKTNGDLVLIDYDGMYVPDLANYLSENNGVEEYQHPIRTLNDFNADLDDFSIALITAALYAIAQQPDLYTEFGSPDNLLFRRSDWEQPKNSLLLKKLHTLNNPTIDALLSQLQTALQLNSLRLDGLSSALQVLPPDINKVEALIAQNKRELLRLEEHLRRLKKLPPTISPSSKNESPVSKAVSPPPIVNRAATSYTETAFGLNLQMVLISGGTFMMGSPASEADRWAREQQHRVTLSDYYIGAYEVTQAQWRAVMGSNPSHFKDDKLPVGSVTWDKIQEFLDKLNAQTGKKYRLPTEAQWEYAARGGTTTPFYTGNCLSTDQANYNGNNPYQNCAKGKYRKKKTPVGSFAANPYGLYDMHGNVWEWCNDWYGDYPSSPVNNPTGPSTGACRVLRGGSWNSNAQYCRVAYRYYDTPGDRYIIHGFRLAVGP